MPRCSSAARGVALVARRDVAGRDAWSESRVTRERRPVGSAELNRMSAIVIASYQIVT
jgi:hypothetical protein